MKTNLRLKNLLNNKFQKFMFPQVSLFNFTDKLKNLNTNNIRNNDNNNSNNKSNNFNKNGIKQIPIVDYNDINLDENLIYNNSNLKSKENKINDLKNINNQNLKFKSVEESQNLKENLNNLNTQTTVNSNKNSDEKNFPEKTNNKSNAKKSNVKCNIIFYF